MTWSIQIHLLFIPQPAKMIGLKEIGSITKVFDNNACLFQTSFVPMLERVENLREMHCLFVTTLKHQNSDFSLVHYCSIMKSTFPDTHYLKWFVDSLTSNSFKSHLKLRKCILFFCLALKLVMVVWDLGPPMKCAFHSLKLSLQSNECKLQVGDPLWVLYLLNDGEGMVG